MLQNCFGLGLFDGNIAKGLFMLNFHEIETKMAPYLKNKVHSFEKTVMSVNATESCIKDLSYFLDCCVSICAVTLSKTIFTLY